MGWRFRRSARNLPGGRTHSGQRSNNLFISGRGVRTTTYTVSGTVRTYNPPTGGGSGNTAPLIAQGGAVAGTYNGELQPDGSLVYTDENGQIATDDTIRELRRQGRATIVAVLEREAQAMNNQAQPLLTVHQATPPPLDAAHYTPATFSVPQPQPPIYRETPPPTAPILEDASWLAKHIPFLLHGVEARNARLLAEHQARQGRWQERERQAQEEYANAELRWETQMESWEDALAAFDADQMLQRRILTAPEAGDETQLAEFLRQRLSAIAWPRRLTVTVGIADEGQTANLAALAPHYTAASAPWPDQIATVSYDQLRLYYKKKLKRDINAEYVAYLHSLAIRLIGEVFAAAPVVETVLLEVKSTLGAGVSEKEELRVRVSRGQWTGLDPARLQATDLVTHLQAWRC